MGGRGGEILSNGGIMTFWFPRKTWPNEECISTWFVPTVPTSPDADVGLAKVNCFGDKPGPDTENDGEAYFFQAYPTGIELILFGMEGT